MDEVFVSEDDRTGSIISTRKDVNIINDKTLSEVLELLFESLKDESDNIDMISRKSIIELADKNIGIVIRIGIETLRNLTTQTTNINDVLDQIEKYINLLKEILEKLGNNLDRNTFKIVSSFVIELIQTMITTPNNPKEAEKIKNFEKKTILMTKLLIYIGNIYFSEVLQDLMQLFNPGSVPHKIVIELLTELALTYPIKTSQNFQDVVSRTLPILASIIDENIRVIFCKFFAQISESVIISLESQENISNVNIDSLSHLFATAFDLIYAQWLNCKNSNNKIYIVNALIMIGSLLPENSMRNNLENIVNIFINNIKKDSIQENLIIVKTFRIFFENIVIKYKERIDITINNLLIAVFPLLSSPHISPNVKDFNQSFMQLKSELLKLFFLFFKNYLDKTFSFLIGRFEVPSLIERLANMYMIKTLLIRCDNINSGYRDMLLSAISKATHESDIEFKYALTELIYILYEKNLLTEDSSIKLLSYLLKETSYSEEDIDEKKDNKSYPFYTTLKILRDKSENVLIDIINKIPDSEKYFWPHILDYLYDFKYNGAAFIISKIVISIKSLFENKMEDFKIDFSQSNLPTPSQILIKLFIILSNPTVRTGITNVALSASKIIIPLLIKDFSKYEMDSNEIEIYLRRGRYFDFNVYNDILLHMFEKTLSEIKNAEFLSSLTESIIDNLTKFKEDDMIMGFLIRLQGVVLSKINKREVIKNHLDNLFNTAHPEFKNDIVNGNQNPSNPSILIRSGVAEAYGLAAKSHLDIILDKINAIFKADIQYKKPTGFTAFFSSNKEPELSHSIITTLIAALGSIAKFADSNLLSTRINSNFLSHIDKYFKDDTKNPKILRIACIISLGNIFRALHKLSSFYIDKGDIFILQNRDYYIECMVKIFKSEKSLNEIKIAVLNNIANLVKLDPPVSLEMCKNFIHLGFSIFDTKDFNNSDEMQERALEAVNNVLESILVHDNHFISSVDKVTVEGFTIVTIENILNYDKDILSCWDFFSFIMEKFIDRYIRKNHSEILCDRIQSFVNSKKSVKFNNEELQNWITSLMCLLIIYFDDNNSDSHGIFLSISRLFTGLNIYDITYNSDINKVVEELTDIIKNKFEKEEFLFIFKKLFYLIKNVNLPFSVNKYASLLMEKLLISCQSFFLTSENDVSKKDLKIIDEIIDELIKTLEIISREDGSTSSERFINVLKIAENFAKINLNPIIEACLKEEYCLPLPVSLTSIIQKICKEKSSVTKVFTKITDIINNGDPGYENKPNYSVCASTIVLGTMLQTHDPVITPLIKKFFPQLLSTLLLRIGSAHSINYTGDAFKRQEEDPRNQTVWALQQLMSYSDEIELSTSLESSGSIQNKLISTYEFDEGIYELMLIFCKKSEHTKQTAMFEFLQGFLDRPWSGQRVAVVSCYAQFVNYASIIHCKNNEIDVVEWRNKLIVELTKTITDSDELARKQSIRGLANLCRVYLDCTVYIENYIRISEKLDEDEIIPEEKKELVKKTLKKEMLETSYGTSIINLLIEKLSDNTESVVLESLNSLQQMMEFLSIKAIIPCLSNLLVKLRPCFDISNHNVRMLGFNLFNRIISLIPTNTNQDNESKDELKIEEIIKEQIHLHLVSLLLHTNDEKPGVRNTCFKTLIKALIVILNQDVSVLMEESKEKYGDNYNKTYDEFITNICIMITEKYSNKIPYHISNCINHSLSPQENIRASSVFLIGIFYDYLVICNKIDVLRAVNLENVFNNFAKLLKDFSSKVKIKAIKSLAFFKSIKSS